MSDLQMSAAFEGSANKKYVVFCTRCHKMFESHYQPAPGDEIFCPKCSKDVPASKDDYNILSEE